VRQDLPIFVDCDPGVDDALALVTLLGVPGIKVLGISTVAGNVTVEATFRNARRILRLLGREDVPVAAGLSAPLKRALHTGEDVHGKDGLGGYELPDSTTPPPKTGGIELMARAVQGAGKAVLLATGPLTNVASALRRKPEMVGHIERIVWMGGSLTEGNMNAVAEFNAFVDPEAARIVLTSGVPVTMIGLNVTHQVSIDEETVAAYREMGGAGRAVAGMLDFYVRSCMELTGSSRCAVHDVVAAVEAAYPGVVGTTAYPVDVEVAGEITTGMTVVDTRQRPGATPNVDVGITVDGGFVLKAITDALRFHARKVPIA